MNIFLIFISMFIMIGYYLISSPSQNLPEQETEYVIEQSDVRSIVECVVAKQNAAMYCRDLPNDCVTRYGVESKYVDVDSSNSLVSTGTMEELCASEAEEAPVMRYIVTSSRALLPDERDNVMNILETFYSDRGTLGIVADNHLIVPDSTTSREIPEAVVSAVPLVDDQLAYVLPYQVPNLPVPGGEDPENPQCPDGTVAVVHFSHTLCITSPAIDWCQEFTVYNPETGECEPTEEFVCPDGQTLIKIDGVWNCYEPTEEIECEDGVIIFNTSTMAWECEHIDDPVAYMENCADKNSEYVFSASELSVTPTLHVKTLSCSRCEKPTVNPDTCEVYCIPDLKKIDTRTCGFGNSECCVGNNMGIYFGFSAQSNLEGLKFADGGPVELPPLSKLLDANHVRNRKFNCMRCKYSSLETSIRPYVAICQEPDSSERVSVFLSENPSSESPCSEPVPIDDDDELVIGQQLIERSANPNGRPSTQPSSILEQEVVEEAGTPTQPEETLEQGQIEETGTQTQPEETAVDPSSQESSKTDTTSQQVAEEAASSGQLEDLFEPVILIPQEQNY